MKHNTSPHKDFDLYEQEQWLFDPSTHVLFLKESGEVVFELNCHPLTQIDRLRIERILAAVNTTAGISNEQLNSKSFRIAIKKASDQLKKKGK